ncbi:MAG: PAS domain-containing sensor histidine kinase [Anaerolineae bacterium]|jgi:signal transduction histidine kinase|nr:PAS domain-containing sensor histidine kinase [Anaerolineae bacterium]
MDNPPQPNQALFDLIHQEMGNTQTHNEQRALLEAVMLNVGLYAYVIERDSSGKGIFRPVFGDFEALFGYNLITDNIDYWFDKLVHPDDKPRFYASQSVLVPGSYVSNEYRYLHRDGHTIWLRLIHRTVVNPTGGFIRYGVIQDISTFRDADRIKEENARLELALAHEKELNATRNYFITSVMHEFRNPLASILLASEMLERYAHKISDEEKIKRLHIIQNQVIQMRSTLDDMALIMNNEIKELGFNPEPQNINDFIHNAIDLFCKGMGAHHHITLQNNLSQNRVSVDIRLLKYIIPTLLNNAAQYSEEGSKIICQLYIEGHSLVISIQDEGIGIPLKDQANIFKPLYRGSNVSPTQHGGGLGLTIAQECATLHHGQIEFESQEGKGATFRLILPYKPMD